WKRGRSHGRLSRLWLLLAIPTVTRSAIARRNWWRRPGSTRWANLQRIAGYWRQAVEQEQALDGEEKLRARRRLHASVTFLGMVRLDGDLDPETGETILTALRAVLDAESRSRDEDDDRTPAQRRADALGEICRQWLDLADRPD